MPATAGGREPSRCPCSPRILQAPHRRARHRRREDTDGGGRRDRHEFELISIDDAWIKNTCDAVAAQCREAGFNVKRTVLPGSTFWNDWTKYPYSATNWNARPLGVQVLALAYRTGEAWNETAFSDPEFDAKLTEALETPDTEARRLIMKDVEMILQSSGVIVQPYWRSLFCHMAPTVRNYTMHSQFEVHLEKTWLDEA